MTALRAPELGGVVARDEDIAGADRFRAVGPFYESQRDAAGRTFRAVRPFYSTVRRDGAREAHVRTDVLWPIGTIRRVGPDVHWRFLPAIGDDDDAGDPGSRYRTMVLPFLFLGRDRERRPYFAVFPLGGTIREFLGRDRMTFALFPLYGYGVVNDVETRTVLWPIVSWTTGEGIRRFRVFPLYGRSSKENDWEKRFVLWPIWSWARCERPGSRGAAFILFPLVGRVRQENQRAWSVLPPLFRWTQAAKRREVMCPWPFVQFVHGDIRKLYLWPLWGRRVNGPERRGFFLWPLGWTRRAAYAGGEIRHFFLVPLFYYERVATRVNAFSSPVPQAASVPPASVASSRTCVVWPLFSCEREGDSARFRTLALWPGRPMPPVERNFAPLWTLYSRARSGNAREDEALWGLFRYRRTGDGERRLSVFPLFASSAEPGDGGASRWSVLMGLISGERQGLQRRFRLLYFLRLGGGEPPPEPSP